MTDTPESDKSNQLINEDLINTSESISQETEKVASTEVPFSEDNSDTTQTFTSNEKHLASPEETAPTLSSDQFSRSQYLQIYLFIALASNIFWLFWETHFDVGFWKDWTDQLFQNGYENFRGDYPPIWSHWLYIVSQFYHFTGAPLENNLLFKYLTQIPITAFHLTLIYAVYIILQLNKSSTPHFHAALLLTTLNPAILFVGPVWGQIDVVPTIPVIFAFICATTIRYQILVMPLFVTSLLIKFQMIAFAPIFGIIFFRNIKIHLIGILISSLVFLIAFLPSILAGNFVQAFSLPYIKSMSLFGASTMNATNLWFLVTGNYSPDHLELLNVPTDSIFKPLASLKRLGMIMFSATCLIIFVLGFLRTYKLKDDDSNLFSQLIFYALCCAVAFFAVLPAMHERYLIPAVLISLAYFASSANKAGYALVLTFISAFNIALTHQIKTSFYWNPLSWLMMFVFAYIIFDLLSNFRWSNSVFRIIKYFFKIKYISLWLYIFSIPLTTYSLFIDHKSIGYELNENEVLLTSIRPIAKRQDYGNLQINLNVEKKPLTVGGKIYQHGFGTHANSRISFRIPKNSEKFSVLVDLDSKIKGADVKFSIQGDGKTLWESPVIYKPQSEVKPVEVDVRNIKVLTLIASAVTSISSDHVNWVNPIITKSTEADGN